VRECDLGYYVVDRSPIHTLSLRIGHTQSIIDCNGGKYNLQHPAIAFLRSKGLSCFHPHSIHSCTIDNQHCHFTGQSVCKWVYYTTYINVQGFTLSNTSLNLIYSLVLEIPIPAIFSCALTLLNYILTHISTYFSRLNHLIT
jgi:hypothetical protein